MMRNLAGGLVGVIIGSYLIVFMVGLLPPDPSYPYPFDVIWPLLVGSLALRSTFQGLLDGQTILLYLSAWLVIGIIISFFSKKGWNTVRTAMWVGVALAVSALITQLLENPDYWNITLNPLRNYDILYQSVTAVVTSLIALLSAVPLTAVIERARRTAETPVPEEIETRCSCGAVFKSNPLICSECGAVLRKYDD
jgi:hypothetical protein